MTDSAETEIRAIVQAGLDTISNAATNAKDALIATGDKRIAAAKVESSDLVSGLAEAMWSVRSGNKTWESVWSHQRDTWKRYAEQALTHLATAGRLVPEGGMPLTAEQVEDVRELTQRLRHVSFRGGVQPLVISDALALLDSLFPATEPAPYCSKGVCSANEGHDGTCAEASGWAHDAYEDDPAPAVPAEGETKAEEPTKFRKKPVEVEAMQYDGKDWRSIAQWMAANGAPMGRTASGLLRIHTLEGEVTASSGDWIIKGTQGEFYPCKPAPFADTFEPASSPVVPAPTETGPWA